MNGEFYHIYNRGLNKQNIFNSARDYSQFTQTFHYYRLQNPKPKFSNYRASKIFQLDENKKIVEILAYCLMPNHFHLLVRQFEEGGISEFMRKFIHSYTKYRNVKNKLQGPLFQGMFKAVRVESEEQLLHLSRYIHLNPLVSYLTRDLNLYPWSSYPVYTGSIKNLAVNSEEILKFFRTPQEYEKFVLDQTDYGISLQLLKHSVLDLE